MPADLSMLAPVAIPCSETDRPSLRRHAGTGPVKPFRHVRADGGQLEKDPNPSKSLVGETRLAGVHDWP